LDAAVVVFPGSNCDRDVAVALTNATGRKPAMVWHRETDLPKADLIVLPGGFSYGDYLRPGAMAAHAPVMRAVVRRAEAGVAVLGICNGFQMLTECGLLPGVLMRNRGLKFLCREVALAVEAADTPFTGAYRAGERIRLPIAHNDGNYFADDATLERIEGEGLVALRYVPEPGAVPAPAAPNGARRDIAGIVNARRNVLGLMPHPERACEPAHGNTDGARLFAGLVEAL
jgi:phosphoribosylformylglycinamidine synthase I